MQTAEIRRHFLEYFRAHGHSVLPSSSLVPGNDPTLLFTNAGMVQFKRVFLGEDWIGVARAATAQKCVRAGGKHNDLEEVGRTARHLTFFEMLGNFSFGDYFKKDAIGFAWELMTKVYGLDPDRFFATVHHTDDEAAELWAGEVGLPKNRIHRLGDKDNFWQMADVGPCGPCSELHYDLRTSRSHVPSTEEFVELNAAGTIVELWNLVFMQYDRDPKGVLHPLPAPCVDTGAGLERLAAVLQGADSVFHSDVFAPLLTRVGELVGSPYDRSSERAVSYRVLADHARAVGFLLVDGVFPSSEGRGYVLRRILRRAVRHAWLLGRREPTLVGVVEVLIDTMKAAYPELDEQRGHVLSSTRAEEERFLATIEGGMSRFEELASGTGGTIPGVEAFKLYDTFGFPLDLTELMAAERGYKVDVAGFELALEEQRSRSRADRAASQQTLGSGADEEGWTPLFDKEQSFIGYDRLAARTEVLACRVDGARIGLVLRENPFYVESGGQVSDVGAVRGEGWTVHVSDVVKVSGRTAVSGTVTGAFPSQPTRPLEVIAEVDATARRDTVRNHTATHLLHAALRSVLGKHVVQRGSLVAPDRLRFDFAHTAPMSPEERRRVEDMVNEGVWANHPVQIDHRKHADAVKAGAMALFGEKYGDEVRVVSIPGVSMELCGGTHASVTAEIGLFRLVSESGVAAGVRRIEALTGRGAFQYLAAKEQALSDVAQTLKTVPENLMNRAAQILEERAELESLIDEMRAGGGAGEIDVATETLSLTGGATAKYRGLRLKARGADDARKWGDAFLASDQQGVAVIAAELPGEKQALFAFVTADLIRRGVRADAIVRQVATIVGGRGGGRPHMAQAGVEDPSRVDEALTAGAATVRELLAVGSR
ncbi:MAG: alanine--tRNA ligase [Gemmatimonadetes bacterium]|nr:alanine--tRNA ligase [Gemmatimonadota bacterium]